MRVVTLEEHFSFAAITNRIDKALIAKRGFVQHGRRPGMEDVPRRLEDVGEGRLKSMDESGITVQVLSVSGPGADLLEGDAGIALARDYNNAIFEKVKAHPTRFAAFAHLPMTAPEAAADELERSIKDLGFCGALINGVTNDRFLDDKQFAPILAQAEKLGVPLYLHPGIPPKAVRDVYYAGMSPAADALLTTAGFGWHAETAIHTLRLIVSGTLDRYPKLQIIIGHMGEMLPMMMARCDGVFSPEFVGMRRSVQQTLRDQVHVTTSGLFTLPPLMATIDTFGIDRVMFSIDYPYSSNDTGKKYLDSLPLAPADIAKIAHSNADRLLRLKK
jgi:predicted TIM-barrel fold metal-dependent hydrolase